MRRIVLLILSCLSWSAWAACSHVLHLPVAATGKALIIHGMEVNGIYADIMADVSARSGCRFTYQPMPRARLETLFQQGHAPLLFPAARTPQRDRFGELIPVVQTRATLIALNPALAKLRTLRDIKKTGLRLAVVRGFDYGAPYQALLEHFQSAGQLYQEVDAVAVARLLQTGFADATVMAPTVLMAAMDEDRRLSPLAEKPLIAPIQELDWLDLGVYVAFGGWQANDRQELVRSLQEVIKSSAVWDSYKRYYPPELLSAAIRPKTTWTP